jgi:mannose/fructose/N-acetylgalactosamine-specific phosphotransferase system component IIC
MSDALGELDSALGAAPLDFSANDLVGSSVGTYLAEDMMDNAPKGTSKWKEWGAAIATGVLVSVGTTLVLNFLNGQGLWQGKGTLVDRWKKS